MKGVTFMTLLVLVAGCRGKTPSDAVDAGPIDAEQPDVVPGVCRLEVTGTAEATGYSPLGTADMPLAWIGLNGGECGGMRAVLVPDRETLAGRAEGGRYGADHHHRIHELARAGRPSGHDRPGCQLRGGRAGVVCDRLDPRRLLCRSQHLLPLDLCGD